MAGTFCLFARDFVDAFLMPSALEGRVQPGPHNQGSRAVRDEARRKDHGGRGPGGRGQGARLLYGHPHRHGDSEGSGSDLGQTRHLRADT